MKFVEIYKTKSDGSQNILAICKLGAEGVICEGDEVFIENIKREGVLDYSKNPPQKVFMKDGLIFLENLKFAFKSGYLDASEIKEA